MRHGAARDIFRLARSIPPPVCGAAARTCQRPNLTILSGGLSVTLSQWSSGEAVMPLLRVLWQLFGALVDHLDGRRGRLCVRGPPDCLILLVHRKPLQP